MPCKCVAILSLDLIIPVSTETTLRFSLLQAIIEDTTLSCQNVCDAFSFLLDNIYIRFGTKLYRQIVGIPMGTNCALLVADLFFILL